MTNYRSVFWLNSLSLVLVAALIVYSKVFGPSVSTLFLPPPSPQSPNVGLLTHTFQILCSVPPIVCAFSFGLLKTIQPQNKQNVFILCSALITGGFLINEIYRVHILVGLIAGVPKLAVIMVYAIAAGGYGFAFRRTIQSTPYILLLTGMVLLLTGISVDSLHLGFDGIPSLLEGIPKLFSEINIALYFWYVCYREVVRSLHPSLRF
jgi:hypothetical protein